nr:hypothetical protein [Prevotella sp.]
MKDEGFLPHRSTIFLSTMQRYKTKALFCKFSLPPGNNIGEKRGKNKGQQGKQQGKMKIPDAFIGILILFP